MTGARSALDTVDFTSSCVAGLDALAFTVQDDRMLQLPMADLRSMWMNSRALSSIRHNLGLSTHLTRPNWVPEPENLFDTLEVPTYYQRIQLTVF